MKRRDFLARLGLAAGAVALSPFLDLAPIAEAPSAAVVFDAGYEFFVYQAFSVNLMCNNPRRLGVVTSIS